MNFSSSRSDHLDTPAHRHRRMSNARMAREPALACEADGNYHICEYYLSALSPVLPDALFLGSVEALRTPASLTRHRVSHVLLLCSHPQLAARSPSGALSGPILIAQVLTRLSLAVGFSLHLR